ncbi:hypothetical protein EVAR_12518_1 [Eumeta japonica]|uniref:Uncharacterized protein n=1 Tax=Eumeta variegata TaxID=151549 RepID=A0A4C1TPQ6_EUMVA|nr:hypothetical protein EVAR_12518_1 [Eumeta japonica]
MALTSRPLQRSRNGGSLYGTVEYQPVAYRSMHVFSGCARGRWGAEGLRARAQCSTVATKSCNVRTWRRRGATEARRAPRPLPPARRHSGELTKAHYFSGNRADEREERIGHRNLHSLDKTQQRKLSQHVRIL